MIWLKVRFTQIACSKRSTNFSIKSFQSVFENILNYTILAGHTQDARDMDREVSLFIQGRTDAFMDWSENSLHKNLTSEQ